MSPPSNYNGTRRVEFSGLPTIDSGAPEEQQTPHWDSETDHLLSYFLGDPNGHSTPGQSYQDFSSAPNPSNADMNPPLGMNASYGPGSSRTSSNSTLTDAADPQQPRTPAMQFYHPSHSSSHSSQQQHQPPQPIGYARHTVDNIASMQAAAQQAQQGQSQLVSSSSSSSLSSLAVTLVSGGPVLHHQMHHTGRHHSHAPTTAGTSTSGSTSERPGSANSGKIRASNSDSPPGHGDDSPISPAAMIGTAQENLMLPPPSRNVPPGTGSRGPAPRQANQISSQSSSQQQRRKDGPSTQQPPPPQQAYPIVYPGQSQPVAAVDHGNKDSHLEWLNQLNARAKAANQNQRTNQPANTTILPPGTLVSIQHQAPPVAQHPTAIPVPAAAGTHVFHAGTFPTAAAAAAAVAQNPMLYQAALNHKFHLAATSQGESEEKRARRLERNRESARKSRRRKKERLATLAAQVDKLHTKIEDERKNQVNAMCSTLKQVRHDEMVKLMEEVKENMEQLNQDPAIQQRLATILRSSCGGSQIAQATVEFQYNTLKQVLLPRYQKFLLWLTLHNDGFFTAGKDEYTRRDGKQILRVSSGRVSSKQIGDELTNGWKTEKSDSKKKGKSDSQDIAERSNPTSRALDAPRMWPLLCFELSISVDQEERLMQALKRLQQMENLADYRSQLAAATKMTSSLTDAIISTQCQIASAREEKSFLDVLSPEQTIKFHEWKAANQERSARFIREKRPAPEKCYPVFKETSLVEFCKRLEEVLRISNKKQDEKMEM
ncbi:bZIP transcription factor [Seminavis robusta]|uniref:BZIP transcription factor n=1 Tax=Seminavis robusta TaxID=568900 RepID=A0A9N8DVI6_9STRA|nr:bZIP transcription factor [Seminavis robusta]|eukprot:Sro383_g131280.1 bZIP transcription factor (772) ;mRNA; f:24274-26905